MSNRTALSLIVLAQLAAIPLAHAGEQVFQFRSEEDPRVTPDLTVCAAAPFQYNVRLTASLWATLSSPLDGRILRDDLRKIGEAHACVQLTNFAFPEGLEQRFYGRFDLPIGSFTGEGTCKLVSNSVPEAGLVLAGCSLKIVRAPSKYLGGIATSTSVFNPFQLAGYNTGSYWTLQMYDNGQRPRWPGIGILLVHDNRWGN